MPASTRRSTPRRGRSSSVASNTSTNAPASPSSSARKHKKEITAEQKLKLSRPEIPKEKNPRLEALDEVPVKLQVIKREGQSIIIGRVKLPTVNGQDHAFLLKRFDTNAIAASSMYRIAFPYADGEAESAEMNYLNAKYDTDRANGGYITEQKKSAPETPVKRGRGRPKKSETPRKDADTDNESVSGDKPVKVLPAGSTGVRLQGVWIPAQDAVEVAEEYGLFKFARPLIEATAEYAADGSGPVLTSVQATPETTKSTTRTKRQRVSKAAEAESDAGDDSSSRVLVTKVHNEDGSVRQIRVDSLAPGQPTALLQDEIDAQIEEAKALAAGIQKSRATSSTAAATGSSPRGRKRRAVNDRPSADISNVDDDEEEEQSGRVVRAFRRGTRVARRRPIATTAGVLTAAGAIGAGAAAWMAGGNIDIAVQTIQQSIQSLGITGWFL